MKNTEIVIIIVALVALAAIWAVNGYDDTWLYVTSGIIIVPASWFFFGKKDKDQ